MLVFKDIITDDELISDSYDLKEIDGVLYEADCAMITIDAVNVDTGANASAEAEEEESEDAAQKVNNIVHSFGLNETSFDAKSYKTYIKGYLKAVKDKMTAAGKPEEEIKTFMAGAKTWMPKLVAGIEKGDFEFFTGESMDPDGMIVLLGYREDGITPYVILWKHGLSGMKV